MVNLVSKSYNKYYDNFSFFNNLLHYVFIVVSQINTVTLSIVTYNHFIIVFPYNEETQTQKSFTQKKQKEL